MKSISLGIGLIALVAASALLDPDKGIGIWFDLREDLVVSEARVAKLRDANAALLHEIEVLEAQPEALERAIREELDLALPGEVVIYFSGAAAW